MLCKPPERYCRRGQEHENDAPDERVELRVERQILLDIGLQELDVAHAPDRSVVLCKFDGFGGLFDAEARSRTADELAGDQCDVTAAADLENAHSFGEACFGELLASEGMERAGEDAECLEL